MDPNQTQTQTQADTDTSTQTATDTAGAFAAAAASTTTTSTDTPAPLAEGIPEKYRVLDAAGAVDVEASTRKLLAGHAELQKRFGAGDVPPAAAEDYAPNVEGVDFEALKADPAYQSFLKGAHAKGLTNAQVEFVVSQWAERNATDAVVANGGMSEADFRQAIDADAKAFGGYDGFMKSGLRTIRTYLPDATAEDLASIPNSPIVAKLLAAVGKELPEDTGTPRLGADAVRDWEAEVATLRGSDAYNDAKHPEHKAALAKMSDLFAKRYPNKK